jgi:hypothetical protein
MALTAGTKLGPYEIQSLLGSGGMGEVYRARDSRLGRIVAIKVLPKSYSADAGRLQRFVQEARSAAALNHPNILSIFDIGEQNAAPYIVSELLEGQTLRERIRSGPLPTRKAVDYALQVARGLAAAHGKGIVHRDLKPENLFVTNDDRVKILDFGLAKLTRPETAAGEDAATVQVNTEPGQIMGTAGYMSPEQVRGKPADHRADIFAFGSILYEMLSGQRAFRGESPADTMSAILKEEPVELSETARTVPPALERMVRHCLEKNPAQRFQSAGDLAFNLEALTDSSVVGAVAGRTGPQSAMALGTRTPAYETAVPGGKEAAPRRRWRQVAGVLALSALMVALGWWLGRGNGRVTLPQYQPVTFRAGSIGKARFTPDGSIVYSASWDGGESQLYVGRADDPGARELGLKNTELLAISKSGELAVRLNSVSLAGWMQTGTLARIPMSGGTPREVLDNVEDADWAPDGENMAVVRYVPENRHWRLEYPIGKILIDGANWISHPKISPDGKWVAFADHQNAIGDDEGSVAAIDSVGKGKEKILSSGWTAVQGILWSPTGDEIWFTSAKGGIATNPRAVTLSGKERAIASVPEGMWLEDLREGAVLIVTHHRRVGIRGMPPGGKEERELGWLDYSVLDDLVADGRKILFEEAGSGGGTNYTVFVRDSDGSPPVRIGEGMGQAISPDAKWVITQPAKGGPLRLVPTGAGEARQLTHDNVNYQKARWLAGGKEVLAIGVEPGHGARDYLISVSSGDSKPLTPEGVVGVTPAPDGRSIVVLGPEGIWGIWPLDGGGLRPIPGLDSNYRVSGWSPDGVSVFAVPTLQHERTGKIYRVNVVTGKMELSKTIGDGLPAGTVTMSGTFMPAAGGSYAYRYQQTLSQLYLVRGMK